LHVNSIFISSNSTCGQNPTNTIAYYNSNWDLDTFDYTLLLENELSNNESSLSSYGALSNIISATCVYNGLNHIDGEASLNDMIEVSHIVWKQSLQRRWQYPSIMSIASCFTNHEVGTFTGITDIIAQQFQLAGCAPNAIVNDTFPATTAYYYYENARMNQMPNPTFAIVQAFTQYFDQAPYSLSSSEITLTIGSALAAGVQGIILQDTDLTLAKTDENAWNAAQALMASVNYLGEILLLSSAHGTVITNDMNTTSLWSALRSVNHITIIAVNINCDNYNKDNCKGANSDVHWICEQTVSNQINITLPSDFRNNEFNTVEIYNGTTKHIDFTMLLLDDNSILQFNNVILNSNETTRIFLISKT